VAASAVEGDEQSVECKWQFQTLQGDEESDCQQRQRQLLSRGLSSRTRLDLQVAIDATVIASFLRNRHPHALRLLELVDDDAMLHQGEGLPCELCLIVLNSVSPSCVRILLPITSNARELITAAMSFEFSQHWQDLHGRSAQFELISAGAHSVTLGSSHVVTLDIPDAINRSKYISAFAVAPSLYHRAQLKNSLVNRLPPPVGSSRFLYPLPPWRSFSDFRVEGLILPTRRAVAMCIVGETRNFFEDGALSAQLIRDNIGMAVTCAHFSYLCYC
jgi:hypothetical protein